MKSVCWLRSIEKLQKAGDRVEINTQAGCREKNLSACFNLSRPRYEEKLRRIILGSGTEIMAETYSRLHTSFTVHILRP